MLKECNKVSDFEIISKLGGGSHGIVLAVTCKHPEHPFPRKLYALKSLFNFGGYATETREKVMKFNHEVDILLTLQHDNIITCVKNLLVLFN